MIPAIGIMIGAYIFTRMVSFIARDGEQSEHWIVKICAIITILITTLMCMYLTYGGLTSSFGTPIPQF